MRIYDIKPKPVYHEWYRFRSKLEYIWAQLFEKHKLEYIYELKPDADLHYLPDFWLSECRCYIEVKPTMPTNIELFKIYKLAIQTGYPVFIVFAPLNKTITSYDTDDIEFTIRGLKKHENSYLPIASADDYVIRATPDGKLEGVDGTIAHNWPLVNNPINGDKLPIIRDGVKLSNILDARWAWSFNKLAYKWKYLKEFFNSAKEKEILPRFFLPEFNCYIVSNIDHKYGQLNKTEKLCKELSILENINVYYFPHDIPNPKLKGIQGKLFTPDKNEIGGYLFTRCKKCKRAGLTINGEVSALNCKCKNNYVISEWHDRVFCDAYNKPREYLKRYQSRTSYRLIDDI